MDKATGSSSDFLRNVVSRRVSRERTFKGVVDALYEYGTTTAEEDHGESGQIAALSVNCDKVRGPFTREEIEQAHELLPHLRNIYGLQRRLSWLEAQASAFREGLDRLAIGVVLLDRVGAVVFSNLRAQQIFAESTALSIAAGHLRAVWPADKAILGRSISRARKGILSNTLPDTFPVRDRSGTSVLSVSVSPISQRGASVWSEPGVGAIAFMHTLQPPASASHERLRSNFGLTNAETDLAAELITGATLVQASKRLQKSINTVRTQLRGLFDKTGTRRQSALLRVLERV